MKEGIADEVMSPRFRHRVVDEGFEWKSFIIGVQPIVITTPVPVKVKVSNEVRALVLAERLVEDGREVAGNFAFAPGRSLGRARPYGKRQQQDASTQRGYWSGGNRHLFTSRFSASLDPDGLDIDELADAELAQVAAIT